MNYNIFVNEFFIEPLSKILNDDITFVDAVSDSQRGYVITVNYMQLWKLDQFFMVPIYLRTECLAKTDEDTFNAFKYIKNVELSLTNDTYASEPDTFNLLSENNELGMCDVHLMIPCSIKNIDTERFKDKNELAQNFLKSLTHDNHYEFKSDFVKILDRYLMGFYFIYADCGGDKYRQAAMVTLSIHPSTNLGVVNISLISPAFPALHALTDFCGRNLCIENENQTIDQWLFKNGMEVYGSPRSVIFAYNELSDNVILKTLASEAAPHGKITGKEFTDKLKINLAQYETAKAYASEVCLLEIIEYNNDNISERITNQTIELFFIELLLLQDAAISRLSFKISEQLKLQIKKPYKKNDEILEELICESAKATMFFDLNEFLFPTTRLSAQNIANCFAIDRVMKTYERNKNILEQMITIREQKREKLESSTMNILLLFLALVQVLPLFINGYRKIFFSNIRVDEIILYLCGIASCFALLIIYKIYLKTKLQRKSFFKKKTKKN